MDWTGGSSVRKKCLTDKSAEKKSRMDEEGKQISGNNVNTTTKLTVSRNAMIERLMLECTLCKQCYDNERVARNLSCGHSLCTECINNTIVSEKLCPECRIEQTVNSAADLSINYPVMRLVRSIINKEINWDNMEVPAFPTLVPVLDGFEDAEECQVHSSPLLFLCVSCSTWVCHDCLVIDHAYYPRGSCRIENMPKAKQLIIKECKRIMELCRNDLEIIQRNFESLKVKANLFFEYGHCPSDTKSHTQLHQEVEKSLDVLKQKDDCIVEAVTGDLNKLGELLERTTFLKEITSCGKEINNCQDKIKQYIKREPERKLPVMRDIYAHFKMDLKQLVMGKKAVYAVRKQEDKVMCSLISIKEDRLIMYSLKEDIPPKHSLAIPYEVIRELIPQRDVTVFFEIGTPQYLLGRVYVMLFGDSIQARQTVLLCSGEVGPCYRNTCFYEYDDNEGVLKGGDYENNDGTGGPPIPTSGENNNGLEFRLSKGLLVSIGGSARFYFYLKNVRKTIKNTIGNVTKGFDVLLEASKVVPVRNAVIVDCGLFISMNINSDSNCSSEMSPFSINLTAEPQFALDLAANPQFSLHSLINFMNSQ